MKDEVVISKLIMYQYGFDVENVNINVKVVKI